MLWPFVWGAPERQNRSNQNHGVTLANLVLPTGVFMPTTLTSKGQVTIPKRIRDALNMIPGCSVDFAVNGAGDVVVHRVGARASKKPDRFAAARGKADIKWRTDDLMALLRGEG